MSLLVSWPLSNCYGPLFKASRLRITGDLSAKKITIDVPDCNSFKALRSSLESLLLEGLEFWNVRLILAQIVSASSFSRSFYCIFYGSYANCEIRKIFSKGFYLRFMRNLSIFRTISESLFANWVVLKSFLIFYWTKLTNVIMFLL